MTSPQPILQARLPFAPWMDARTWRLPGVLPLEGEEWLRFDDAYAAQMAERDRLIAEREPLVHALLPASRQAAEELMNEVLAVLARTPGFRLSVAEAERPDGVTVALDRTAPLRTLGRLVQEDFCLMQAQPLHLGEESVLTGAILCFPASWTLAEKLGQPLVRIHLPVERYTQDVARRVQRMFDAIRPGQMLWRANALLYDDFTLHQPRVEGARRPKPLAQTYVRSERQTLRRLPQSGAVVFGIHTYVVLRAGLSKEAEDCILGLLG